MALNSVVRNWFILLCLLPAYAKGQFYRYITFDEADTFYQHVVFIDTESHHNNTWQIGKPNKPIFDSAYSYRNAIVTDTAFDYPPNDTSVFIVKLLNQYSGAGPIDDVEFRYRMDIDTGSKGLIEYSMDTGHTWLIAGSGWPYSPDTTTFTFSHFYWNYYHINLMAVWDGKATDSVWLRFTFISDSDFETKDGWMIDNFSVHYFTSGVMSIPDGKTCNIYPNPAQDILNITTRENIHCLTISNLIGQQVYCGKHNAPLVTVNIKYLPPGLYLVGVDDAVIGNFIKE